jgi:SOS response regulatory protein OraA/RecX
VESQPAGNEALAVAMRALARREYSQRGLRERLARAGVPTADAEAAVEELRETGLLDEGRFAVERARVLAERGRGDSAIRFELEREVLEADAIEGAMAELEPEHERAARLVSRRGATSATARLLASRGFDEDVVAGAVAPEP